MKLVSTPRASTAQSAPTTQPQSHASAEVRPLTAPGILSEGDIFSEQPHPSFAVRKNQALQAMRDLAAQSTGTAQEILNRMAAAAGRVEQRIQSELRCQINERYVPPSALEGRIERRVFRGNNGEPRVRAVFSPNDKGQKQIWLAPNDVVGLPNGAPVIVRPGARGGAVMVEPQCAPLPNLVGRLELDDRGQVVVQAVGPLTPYSRVVMNAQDAPKLKEMLSGKRQGGEVMVLVDLDHSRNPPEAVFHDFIKANRLQILELDAALSAGIDGTFNAAELVQAEQIARSEPLREIPAGLRDERAEIDIATDNEGSHTDHISQDPEQAATVIDRGDRYIVKYKLAYSRPLVPPNSPIADHGADNPATFYGSGFDLPANPRAINMDKAVLLQGQARYAVTVECHINKTTGQPILEDCGAYETVVENDWQGTYRKAQIHFELQRKDLSPEDRAKLEAVKPELSPQVCEQLDLARAAHRIMRQAYVNDGGLLTGSRDGYESEDIVHSFSTTANEVLGYLLNKAGAPAVNRVHPKGKVEQFAKFTRDVGVPWDQDQQSLAEYLRDLPARLGPDKIQLAEVIGSQAIRFTGKAYYSSTETGHFGMGKEFYAHGSASNRLVSGLLNLANAVAATKKLKGEDVEFPYSVEQANHLAARQSEMQSLIDNVEQEQHSIRDALALQPHVGESLPARVHNVSMAGVTFQLASPSARVFIPMRDLKQALQSRFEFPDPLTLSLGKRRFAIGDTVDLRIEVADPELHQVQAMLADVPAEWTQWQSNERERERSS